MDYASKAKSSNVRGVGTFFDACLNLGQFSYAYLKICIVIYPVSRVTQILKTKMKIKDKLQRP